MRKKLAILLISLHLVGNTEAGQLFKFPQLIRHFHQHQEKNGSLGFISFIMMHYVSDDGTTADDDQDQQLPCHNLQQHTMHIVFSPMDKTVAVPVLISFAERNYISHLSGNTPEMPLPVDIQPPRIS